MEIIQSDKYPFTRKGELILRYGWYLGSTIYEIEKNVIDPANTEQMKLVISNLIDNKDSIKDKLEKRVPEIKKLALYNFTLLKDLVS